MPISYGNVAGRIHREEQPLPEQEEGPMKRCMGCRRMLPESRFAVYEDGRHSAKCAHLLRRASSALRCARRTEPRLAPTSP